MTKWEDLKVYKLIEPDKIPSEFKSLAQSIADNLKDFGFVLKQSKTVKEIRRVSNDLLQTIYISNTNPYEKNKKEIKLNISIKPLFLEEFTRPFYIVEPFELDKSIKMGYVLCQENNLLAIHLTEKIKQFVIPFFDKFKDSKSVCRDKEYLFQFSNFGNEVENLILHSSFYNNDDETFLPLIASKIDKFQNDYDRVSLNLTYSQTFKERLDLHRKLLETFTDKEQLNKKIIELNRLITTNLKKL